MSDNGFIQVFDLKKHYNGGEVKALDGVNCTINKGEVVVTTFSSRAKDTASATATTSDINSLINVSITKSTLTPLAGIGRIVSI